MPDPQTGEPRLEGEVAQGTQAAVPGDPASSLLSFSTQWTEVATFS